MCYGRKSFIFWMLWSPGCRFCGAHCMRVSLVMSVLMIWRKMALRLLRPRFARVPPQGLRSPGSLLTSVPKFTTIARQCGRRVLSIAGDCSKCIALWCEPPAGAGRLVL